MATIKELEEKKQGIVDEIEIVSKRVYDDKRAMTRDEIEMLNDHNRELGIIENAIMLAQKQKNKEKEQKKKEKKITSQE
jgi:hypothetical protein